MLIPPMAWANMSTAMLAIAAKVMGLDNDPVKTPLAEIPYPYVSSLGNLAKEEDDEHKMAAKDTRIATMDIKIYICMFWPLV